MKTRLKICGLTRLEDARYCAAAGADYLGFIQYEGSPRYLPPEAAREIVEWLYGPETVGVFVDADAAEVNRVAALAGFDLVQLHGDETPDVCAAVERPVIKAFRVHPDDNADTLRARIEPYLPHIRYALLDTASATAHGGTGETFDWTVAAGVARDVPLFLAGGLNAGNVARAIAEVHPFAVDVSSGVESAPGVKDLDLLAAFFEALAPEETP